jgi:hypothetical protein
MPAVLYVTRPERLDGSTERENYKQSYQIDVYDIIARRITILDHI